MAYRDPAIKKRHFVYFFIILFLMTLWNLGLPELSNQEAFMAVVAKEICENPFTPHLTYQINEGVEVYPLYIRILAMIGWFWPNLLNQEWIIRLPVMLAGMGLVVISMIYCYRYIPNDSSSDSSSPDVPLYASLATGTLIATSLIFWRMTSYANSEIILAFFLTLSWLTFHYLSLNRKYRKWGLWLLCTFSLFLGFQLAGWRVFVLFYLPLCFQKRHYRVWQSLVLPQHFLSLALVILAIIFLPGWNSHHNNFLMALIAKEGDLDIINHWFSFPIKSILYLFPIGICFWVGFCSWYRSLDPSPIFSSFFRRVSISIFLLLWLFPGSSPRQIILILPLLAILSSKDVAILIRRGEYFFAFVWGNLAKFTFLTITTATTFVWLIVFKVIVFEDLNLFANGLFTATSLSFLLFITLVLCFKTGRYPFFLRIFAMIAMMVTSWQMAVVPILSWYNNPHRYHGQEVLSGLTYNRQKSDHSLLLPQDCVVIREAKKVPALPGESYYLNRKIIATNQLEETLLELEKKGETTFYVLTGGRKPELSEKTVNHYEWKAISNICYIERNNTLSTTTKQANSITPENFPSPRTIISFKRAKSEEKFDNEIKARMYCGTLITPTPKSQDE